MKTIKYILPLALVIVFGSCDKDFLEIEPVDRLTADNFYKSEAEIKAATASLYGYPWFDFNDKFFWCAGDLMAGDVYHIWDQEGQYFYFTHTEGNAHLAAGWRGLFRVISYANSIINDMPSLAAGNVSQEVIDRALGEARFIRGTAYYILAEFWGEVPIVENSTELVTNNNLLLPKNTQSSVYEFIRRDLAFAADNLPPADEPGRVTSWSAKGMLAKLHLTMAQHLGNSESAANFTMARDLAADVINNSGLSLMANYDDLFKIEFNNNAESLFALQWLEGQYGTGNSRQANYARSSLITGNSEAWGGFKSATYDFVDDVAPNDKRQPAIYMTLGDYYPGIREADGGYTYNLITRDPDDPNIVLEGAAPVLNNLKKYVVGSADDNDGKVSTGQATALNTYILRLADVYLIHVEATIGAQSSTSDATALSYFNAIRSRAGLSSVSEVTFTELLRERRIEFGLEGINWFDIKRYYYRDPGGVLTYLNGQERGHNYYRDQSAGAADENSFEGYILQTLDNPIVVTEDDLVLPIPAGEVVSNPMLAPEEPAVEYDFN